MLLKKNRENFLEEFISLLFHELFFQDLCNYNTGESKVLRKRRCKIMDNHAPSEKFYPTVPTPLKLNINDDESNNAEWII